MSAAGSLRPAAIAGVGYSPFTKASGRSVLDQALEACRGAIADAGLGADAVDGIDRIEDEAAVEMTRRLARQDGIFAGISTGANVVGALRLAERLGSDAVVVTLAVDSGFKYVSVAPYGDL